MTDLLVLGSGVAGLSAAVRAAALGLDVVLLTKGEIGHSTTRYAQGGVAAVLTADDSPASHLADTLSAGAGLCDVDAARVLVDDGPARVRDLMTAGAEFDRTGDALAFAREGGHSAARVVHAGGDATGAEIERALVAALRTTGVDVREGWFALDLLVEGGRAVGVLTLDDAARPVDVRARHTLFASGGTGQLFAVTTNPAPATGDGTAMALRAGVPVGDLEFMQFHPTALHHAATPRTLISEAVRGEGAVLRDDLGEAFMADEHPLRDLAPRDIVSRAIAQRLAARGVEHVWLDATGIKGFAARFPTIDAACRDAGIDPGAEWIPVAPAAHYHCGGVLTDLSGASALPGLWAVGEAACTGAHGANRLASNSLLEGLVFAPRAVEAITVGKDAAEQTGALRGVDLRGVARGAGTAVQGAAVQGAAVLRAAVRGNVPRASGEAEARLAVQRVMTAGAGVLRSGSSLREAAAALEEWADRSGEVGNLVEVGRALCRAALVREESRGAHTRADFPAAEPSFLGRFVHRGTADPQFVPLATATAPVP